MGYKIIPVTVRHTAQNQSGEWFEPMGIVLHETATPGATDENEFDYFNRAYRGANAHEFVDYDSITQFVDLGNVAWHAGWKANHRYIGIEMCNFGNDKEKFDLTWQHTVGRVASLFVEYGWTLRFGENDMSSTLVTHHWVTKNIGGTNHVDPTAYLAKFGCSFQDFYHDVELAIAELTAVEVVEEPVFEEEVPAPAYVERDIEVWVQGVNVTSGALEGVLKEDGRTYVPVRLVGEAFNEPVGWHEGDQKIVINGSLLDTSFIRDGVGYAWARELAEALRSRLDWDGDAMAVIFS